MEKRFAFHFPVTFSVQLGVTVRASIVYITQTPLVRVVGNLNSKHYISEFSRPVAVVLRLRKLTFLKENGSPHIACRVLTCLDTECSIAALASPFPDSHPLRISGLGDLVTALLQPLRSKKFVYVI
ncbi:hypothetical protein TNCV_3904161 [Trichonephila clavipes]|nr:hypothetical protein TNCV_3904161 [Trichonephila clavipes]